MARVLRALLAVVLCVAAYCELSEGLKMPFGPIFFFFLLMLPRQVSWPVLNTIHNAVNFLPLFVGSVSEIVQWNGSCVDGKRRRRTWRLPCYLASGGFRVWTSAVAGSSLVPIAVKKLETPEGGEKQFRMEQKFLD